VDTCSTCGRSLVDGVLRCLACGADVAELPGFPLESGIAGWPPVAEVDSARDEPAEVEPAGDEPVRGVERLVVVPGQGPTQPPPPPPGSAGAAGPAHAAGSAGAPTTAGVAGVVVPTSRRRELAPLAILGVGVLLVSILVTALYKGPTTLAGGLAGVEEPSGEPSLTPTLEPDPTWSPQPRPTTREDARQCAPRLFSCEVDDRGRITAVSGELCPNRVVIPVRDESGRLFSLNPCGWSLGEGKMLIADPDGDAVPYESLP
jgi:hypothetical protein